MTTPLAAMSILNTTIFCLNLESALQITDRIWIECKRRDNRNNVWI